MLIVVFTRKARSSEYVRQEVSLFLCLRKWVFWRRPISILDVEGEWQRILQQPTTEKIETPWEEIRSETREKLLLYETETTFASGNPSRKICARYGEWKPFERLRSRDVRIVIASLVIAVALSGTTFVSVLTLRRAEIAAAFADQARKSAIALKLGAQAQQAVSLPYGLGVETGVLLAMESAGREANVDAYRAATDGLEFMPRPVRSAEMWSGVRGSAWLSPNGRYVVFFNDGFEVKRADTGEKTGVIPSPDGSVSLVAFSTDGEFVLTTKAERRSRGEGGRPKPYTTLRVFRLADVTAVGKAVRLNGEFLVETGALGPHATMFAVSAVRTAGSRYMVLFGATANPDSLVNLPVRGHDSFPILSDDAKRLAIIDHEEDRGRVAVWSIQSLLAVASTPRKPSLVMERPVEILAAAFSPDGAAIATSERARQDSRTSTIRLWSASVGQELVEPMPHAGTVRTLGFSSDGRHLFTVDDETVRIWSTDGNLLRVDRREGAFFDEQPRAPVSIGKDDLIVLRKKGTRWPEGDAEEEIFDVVMDFYSLLPARSRLVSTRIPEDNSTGVAAVSREGRHVVAGTARGITIYSPDGSARPVELPEAVEDAGFSEDGQWIVVVGKSDLGKAVPIILIRTRDGTAVWRGSVPRESGTRATVSNNGIIAVEVSRQADSTGKNIFVFDYSSGETQFWEFGEAPPEYSPDHPDGWVWPGVPDYSPGLVSITSDGRCLLMTGEVLDARNATRIALIPTGYTASFAQDCGRVYLAQGEKFVSWDPRTDEIGPQRFRLPAQKGGAISRDSQWSLIPDERFIWVYRTQDGTPLAQIDFGSRVLGAAFSADGKSIVASGKDARLRVFLWQPDDLVQVAREFVTRPLNDEERDKYLLSRASQASNSVGSPIASSPDARDSGLSGKRSALVAP
jgi:WD40 repeat protein